MQQGGHRSTSHGGSGQQNDAVIGCGKPGEQTPVERRFCAVTAEGWALVKGACNGNAYLESNRYRCGHCKAQQGASRFRGKSRH